MADEKSDKDETPELADPLQGEEGGKSDHGQKSFNPGRLETRETGKKQSQSPAQEDK
jgi:hypothetical protein